MIGERIDVPAGGARPGPRHATAQPDPLAYRLTTSRSAESAVRRLADWRWPVAFAVLMTLAVEIPYRLAASQSSLGAYFVGMFWAPHDIAQYSSAMRQGASNASWLIYDRFTQEPHAPALMYTFYVAIGKLAWAIGVGFDEMFLLASTAGRLFLALSVYYFAAIASRDHAERRLALAVIALSTGITTVLALFQLATGVMLPLNFRELNDPELNTFLTFFTAPHLMFSLGLLLIAARLYADCWERVDRRRLLALGGVVAALGLTNPFPLVPLCMIVGTHALVMTAGYRRIRPRGFVAVAAVGVAAAPFLFASLVTFTADPFWGPTYGRQNVTLTPAPDDLIVGLGAIPFLALVGLRRFARPLTPGRVLVLLWIAMALVLMHAPTGIQRRFGVGLHPMLALVATFGLHTIWRALNRLSWPTRLLRPFATAGLAQALFGSSAYMYVVAMTIALAPSMAWRAYPDGAGADRSSYQQASVRAAADWLAATVASDDVVLTSTLTGNYLAGLIPGRVYVGHWVATLDYDAKKARAEWFFASPLDEERRSFLVDSSIDYVVIGPAERLLGATRPDDALLKPVFQSDDTAVYRVERPAEVLEEPRDATAMR